MKKTILLCMIMVMGVWAFGQKDSIAPIVLDEVALKTFRLELPQDKTPFALSRFRFSLADPPRPESSLDAFLVATPGLFIQNSTNYAQDSRIAIRGFGSRAAFGIRGIKLIVDGIPETTPDGQGQVDNLTLGLIRSIEVLRGAQSALYGNASGGVILINTADFETLDRAAASVRWGSYGLQQHRVTTHWGSAAQKWLVHAERFKTTGYREASGMLSHQLQLKARFERPEQGQWNWQINYTDSPYAQDAGGLTLEEVQSQRRQARSRNIEYQTEEAVRQFKTGLSYKKTRGTQSLHAYGFYAYRDFEALLPFENGGAVALQRGYFGQGVRWQKQISKGKLQLGYDWAQQQDYRTRYDNRFGVRDAQTLDQVEKFNTLGTFAMGQWSIKRSVFMANLRYDTNVLAVNDRWLTDGDASDRLLYNTLNPSMGWQYALFSKTALFTNFSTAFETPALSELSADPQGSGGFNPKLKPQKSQTVELGGRSLSDNSHWELVFFWIRTQDELTPYELSQYSGRTFYQNAGSTLRKGIEFFYKQRLSSSLEAMVSYTFSDLKFDRFITDNGDYSGNQLPGLPRHFGFAQLVYEADDWQGRFSTQYRGEMFTANDNAVAVAPVWLMDLSLQRVLDFTTTKITPYVGVQNLTQQDYYDNIRINAFGRRYYEPAAGRQWYFGVKVGLK